MTNLKPGKMLKRSWRKKGSERREIIMSQYVGIRKQKESPNFWVLSYVKKASLVKLKENNKRKLSMINMTYTHQSTSDSSHCSNFLTETTPFKAPFPILQDSHDILKRNPSSTSFQCHFSFQK